MSRERVTQGVIPRRLLRWDRDASQSVGPHYYAIAGIENVHYESPEPGRWVVMARRNRSDERHYVTPTELP